MGKFDHIQVNDSVRYFTRHNGCPMSGYPAVVDRITRTVVTIRLATGKRMQFRVVNGEGLDTGGSYIMTVSDAEEIAEAKQLTAELAFLGVRLTRSELSSDVRTLRAIWSATTARQACRTVS